MKEKKRNFFLLPLRKTRKTKRLKKKKEAKYLTFSSNFSGEKNFFFFFTWGIIKVTISFLELLFLTFFGVKKYAIDPYLFYFFFVSILV